MARPPRPYADGPAPRLRPQPDAPPSEDERALRAELVAKGALRPGTPASYAAWHRAQLARRGVLTPAS